MHNLYRNRKSISIVINFQKNDEEIKIKNASNKEGVLSLIIF